MVTHRESGVYSLSLGERRAQAERFIEALAGSRNTPVTFQTFPDGDESSTPPAVMHGTLDECWDRLLDLQEYGHGVFVMVAEGDGKGRAATHVVALRALFADDDHGSVRLASLPLRPSIVVSSGNGAHFYWLLLGSDAKRLADFSGAQKAIAAKLGTDPKVCDLPRVLRLPGTYNLKDRSKPALVELVAARPQLAYGFDVILNELGATPIAPHAAAPAPSLSGPRVLSSGDRARAEAYISTIHANEGEGGDLATYRVAALLLSSFGLDRATAWDVLKNWNATNAHPAWDERDLGRKFQNAERYREHRGPMPERLADAMSGVTPIPGEQNPIDSAAASDPRLDPALWCYDPSQRGRPWRFWRNNVWQDGISNSDLERLLENEGGLVKRAVKAWMRRAPVVEGSAPVYASGERIAQLPDGTKVANIYRPPDFFYTPPTPGDWTAIESVLRNLVGDAGEEGYRWLLGWLGKVVQSVYAGHPARVGTAPVFTGAKGAGKGVMEEVLKACLGVWNVACVTQADLNSDFNSYLDGALLVSADEVFTSDSRAASQIAKIKNLITATTRTINKKGVAQVQRRAVENWWFMSNSHRAAEIERGDRRFTVFRTGGPIPVELGALIGDDARAGGPITQAFLAHLLAMPASELASDYRPLETTAKSQMRHASGNSATKFAAEVAERGFWSLTAAWAAAQGIRTGPQDLYLVKDGDLRRLASAAQTPVILKRKLMDVYRAYANEIAAPVQQESTLMAALREEMAEVKEAELQVEGRRERVVAGLPRMLPDQMQPSVAAPEASLPTQPSLL